MPNPKRAKKDKTNAVPNSSNSSVEKGEQGLTWTPGEVAPRYVVVRNGVRVSDKDYPQPDDSRAIAERDFWQRVVTRWPDGTKIDVVPFDKKKHRIW